jgi:Zn-dependent protease
MFERRMTLFTVQGIPIRIDASWLLIAALVTWSLAMGVFPSLQPDLTPVMYWAMGAIGAILLFTSIVLHELAHAVVAQSQGMQIRGITLFIFGGVAELQDEPPSARTEFLVAIAGPIASIAIAATCWGAATVGRGLGWPPPVTAVLAYVAIMNGILVAFNLVPAFPLDGGRVLRSLLWHWKHDLQRATRIASEIGSAFGIVLIVLGFVSLVSGNLIGGFWWILIGMFLRNAAKTAYQQVIIRRALEGDPVRRFMTREPHTVPPNVTISDFVENYLYQFHHKLFPVTEDGDLRGCLHTRSLRLVPRESWPVTTVSQIAEPCGEENTIVPDMDAVSALGILNRTGASRLLVVDNGRLIGILSLKDLLRFLSLKVELNGDEQPGRLVPTLVGR